MEKAGLVERALFFGRQLERVARDARRVSAGDQQAPGAKSRLSSASPGSLPVPVQVGEHRHREDYVVGADGQRGGGSRGDHGPAPRQVARSPSDLTGVDVHTVERRDSRPPDQVAGHPTATATEVQPAVVGATFLAGLLERDEHVAGAGSSRRDEVSPGAGTPHPRAQAGRRERQLPPPEPLEHVLWQVPGAGGQVFEEISNVGPLAGGKDAAGSSSQHGHGANEG